MVTPISVSFSGPAFSFLLYENAKCRFQQEGFLLGEIVHKETKTITDNDQQQINIDRTIKINSVMPCPQVHYFYDGIGKIDHEKIRVFLGNQFSKVVAWYKYQKVPSAKFTLRNKIIHRQLSDLFGITPELFSCCILTTEISENGSTHLFSQEFIRCHSLGIDKLPMNIPNLSEPNNMYKSSEPSSETFNKILGDLKLDMKNTQGLALINKIQNAVQKHVETLVKDLLESEKYLYELEEEVRQLEIKKKAKKRNEDNLDSINDSMPSSSQIVSNEHENKKRPDDKDTPSSGDSSSEVQRRGNKRAKKNEDNLDSINDSMPSSSQIVSNEHENKKRPDDKDTPSSGDSSAVLQRRGNKRVVKKQNEDNLDSINDSMPSSSQIVLNEYENKRRPDPIDTPPGESYPEVQGKTSKRGGRGRGGQKSELRKNSKTEENGDLIPRK